jgi:hypothetical protein
MGPKRISRELKAGVYTGESGYAKGVYADHRQAPRDVVGYIRNVLTRSGDMATTIACLQ